MIFVFLIGKMDLFKLSFFFFKLFMVSKNWLKVSEQIKYLCEGPMNRERISEQRI